MEPKRVVVVTGCSTGIGRCVALGLSERGYRVFATARRQDHVDELNALGLESFLVDLTDSGSIRAFVAKLLYMANGKIYGLFNNAGYGQPGAVEDLNRQALQEQFEILFGTMELTNLILPSMRKRKCGRIIQNSSVLGLTAMKFRGAYVANKFALEGLTDSMRLELDGSGIHVSLIEPGPIISRFRANSYTAFKKHIQSSNSVHQAAYAAMEKRLTKEGPAAPFTLHPEAVLKKVIAALESKTPKIRYYVTIQTHVFALLRRALPFCTLDWVVKKLV